MSKISQKLKNLPIEPGCYLFKNKQEEVIYIGKAKNISKRVKSYFRKNLDEKTGQLAAAVADVDFFVTDNELEAFLLEAKLIRDRQPKYNLKLKGGVRYAYIKISAEKFPRLETVRSFGRHDKVFGPFVLSQVRQDLIRLANILFKLKSDNRQPVKVGSRYKIRCSTAPWTRLVSEREYKKDVAKAELLLKGKTFDLIKKLKKEMQGFSADRQFELAKIRRDQISALRNLTQKQTVQLRTAYDQDVINYIKTADTFFVQLFNINKGVVSGRLEFKFSLDKVSQKPADFLAEFISQYYYSHEIPQEIIIPDNLASRSILVEYLTKLAGRQVNIIVPQKGDKLRLLELVRKNIAANLKRGDSALFNLQLGLGLAHLPQVIECFDVSNLGDSNIVGSMVNFKNGLSDKNSYRRFKIKWQRGQSDFAAIREIIFRRYYRLKIENAKFPDLILVDGGKPQLTAASQALKRLGLSLPVAALAKKQEELFLVGKIDSIKLAKQSDALRLIQKIRDEAHRFGIAYQRSLRRIN